MEKLSHALLVESLDAMRRRLDTLRVEAQTANISSDPEGARELQEEITALEIQIAKQQEGSSEQPLHAANEETAVNITIESADSRPGETLSTKEKKKRAQEIIDEIKRMLS